MIAGYVALPCRQLPQHNTNADIMYLEEKVEILETRCRGYQASLARKGDILENMTSTNNKLHVLRVLKVVADAKETERVCNHFPPSAISVQLSAT